MKPSLRLFLLLALFLFGKNNHAGVRFPEHSGSLMIKEASTQPPDFNSARSLPDGFTVSYQTLGAFNEPLKLLCVKDNENEDEDPPSFKKDKSGKPLIGVKSGSLLRESCSIGSNIKTRLLRCRKTFYYPSCIWRILLQVFRI